MNMKTIIIFLFNVFVANSFSISKYSKIFKNFPLQNKLSQILKNDLKPSIILNGKETTFKKDFCKNLSNMYNTNFKEYTFDDFMLNLPYNKYENSVIYVNDFLVKNGRILNEYEENKLIELSRILTSNLIIFESDNIDTIPFKDLNLIKRFEIIQFPNIEKKHIIQLIYDSILLNKYNDDMYLINWNNFDIEKWDLNKINDILSRINTILNEKIYTTNNIHKIITNLSK